MDYTSKMVALMKSMRRERNGAVADAMCTSRSGLNYGVSLPTVREIARAEPKDYDFARMLWTQDVRELRLAALHIADPQRFVPEEFAVWAEGIRDEELAEETAFALLSHAPHFVDLFPLWIASPMPLLRYAVLQGAARSAMTPMEWIAPAVAALSEAFSTHENRLIANGVVAMLAALAQRDEAHKSAVRKVVKTLGDTPSARYVAEEMEWRLEF